MHEMEPKQMHLFFVWFKTGADRSSVRNLQLNKSYLPPPWVETIRVTIVVLVQVNRSKVGKDAPSLRYEVPIYRHIFHGLAHDAQDDVSHSQCLHYNLHARCI